MAVIKRHHDLDVYQMAFEAAMEIFYLSKDFPKEEQYSLTRQIRRSSRSVCANLAEAFRKRKYSNAFVAKLSDCEAEAAETQCWLDFALECKYIGAEMHQKLYLKYDQIIGKLVNMARFPSHWKPPS